MVVALSRTNEDVESVTRRARVGRNLSISKTTEINLEAGQLIIQAGASCYQFAHYGAVSCMEKYRR